MKNKVFYKSILLSVVFWVSSTNYFVFARFFAQNDSIQKPLYLDILMQASFSGIVIGLLFPFIDRLIQKSLKRRKTFAFILVLNTIIFCLLFYITIFLTASIGNQQGFALQYVFKKEVLVVMVHLFFSSLLYHFIRQMSKKMGRGTFIKYIIGKYFNPKEEQRLFMFLDLKGSVEIAESIPHIQYSKLLQECFNLLTNPLLDNEGQIYQYVGDEVVITWTVKDNKADNNYFLFYKQFNQLLLDRQSHFQKHYGHTPYFKAGVDYGYVTVAEVGELKSEIVYHGDTLNTASRIQSKCNELEADMLVSKKAYELLSEGIKNQLIAMNALTLKGKKKAIQVYGIKKTEPLH